MDRLGTAGCLFTKPKSRAGLSWVSLVLETEVKRRFVKVSIVSYSRPSLMITASVSQFHVYLPWIQRPFSIVSSVLNVKAEGSRCFQSLHGGSMRALVTGAAPGVTHTSYHPLLCSSLLAAILSIITQLPWSFDSHVTHVIFCLTTYHCSVKTIIEYVECLH